MSGMKIWRTLEVLEKEGNNNVKNERETFRLRERERERERVNGQLQITSLWFGGFSLCLPLF